MCAGGTFQLWRFLNIHSLFIGRTLRERKTIAFQTTP